MLTSTAISAERLGKTLHVLLMTPITTWQIISGKLFSRLLVALTLIGLSLPALALVRLLGGVELAQMAGVVCVCVATVMATATMGLLLSTFMNRAYAAILLSYAAMLLLYGFVPFVLVFGFELNPIANTNVYSAINPFICAGTLADPRGATMFVEWVPCALVHVGMAGVFVAASAVVLRRTSRRAGEGREAAPLKPGPASPAEATPPPAVMPDVQDIASTRPAPPPRPARDVSDHPVLWRETRRPLMAKPWQAIVGAAASVVLMLATYVVLHGDRMLESEWVHAGYAWVFNLVVWLLSSVLAATAIAQEKESDTWTLLLTTPLSGSDIVWGKVTGLYRRLAWPAALIVTHFVAFTLAGIVRWPALLLTLWVIFSFNSVWVAAGVYLSLRVKKVTFAVILNLLLAVGVYLGVFFVLVVLAELSGPADRDLPQLVGWYLPYFYLGVGICDGWTDFSADTLLLPNDSQVSGYLFLAVVFVTGLVHLAVGWGVLQSTAARFDRIVGRAPQARPVRRGFDALVPASANTAT